MSNSPLVTYTNLTKNHSGKRKHKIDTITIHCIVAQWTAKQGCDYFATTDRECSANYVVGKDGSIGLSVEECNRSWCSSNAANDHRAITIEVASATKHPYAVTDKAYAALVDLVTDICKRNGIKKLLWKADKSLVGKVDQQNMTVHRWFANKACPGDYLYERHGAIAEEVNKRLGAAGKPVEPAVELYRVREAWDKPKTQKGAYKVLKNAQAAADKHGLSVFNAAGEKVYPVEAVKIAGAKSFNKAAAGGVNYVVNSRTGLNVRTSPSDKDRSNIIKAVPHGTRVTWFGYFTGNFYFVQFADNSTGYVHSKFLRKA